MQKPICLGTGGGKLYERYKRNWIPTADSCAVSTIGRNSFRHVLVATASVTPSVFLPHISSTAGKPPVGRGIPRHQDPAKWIEVVPRATLVC